MRLYASGPSASSGSSASSRPSASDTTAKPRNEEANEVSKQPQEQKKDTERLMHPPMPKIPQITQNSAQNCMPNNTQTASGSTLKSKFPSPEELMAAENSQDTAQIAVQSKTDSTAKNENTPKFDNVHEQGNYEFTEAEREQMFEDGEGYLKLEVSGGGQPLDCALAAVFRVTDSGDVLTATFFTDVKGETEVITLPVLGLDEKYAVTVAKEGFFTVRDLEIPIFDSIKSIQPVELKQEQK